MKFYEMEEGKTYNIAEGNCLYRIKNGNVEYYRSSVEEWEKTSMQHKRLYEIDFIEIKGKKNGWERVEEGSEYYFVDSVGEIMIYDEDLTKCDEELYSNCNYFSTKEKAEQIRDMNLLQRLMQKFADEENVSEENCNYSGTKWQIILDKVSGEYETFGVTWMEVVGTTYFNTKEIAERCINEIIKPFYNR